MSASAVLSCCTILSNMIYNSNFVANAFTDYGCTFETGCKCGAKDRDDILNWNQGNWGDPINANWADFIYSSGGHIIAKTGCYLTSVGILMKMSGVFNDFCLMQWFHYARDYCVGGGGGFDHKDKLASIPNYENKFITGVDVTSEALGSSTSGGLWEGGHKDLYKVAVEMAKKGYYVVVEKPGHFMPVVGLVDSSNELGCGLVISEVGSTNGDPAVDPEHPNGTYMAYDNEEAPDGYYKLDTGVYYLISLRIFVCESSPFTGVVKSSNGSSNKDTENLQPTLVGLNQYFEENYFVSIDYLNEQALKLPQVHELREEIGLQGIDTLNSWKDTIDNQHEDKRYRYIRSGVMFFGIIMMIYSLLLFIAYQFDRVNNFLEISLLGMLTFNRLSVSPDERSTFSNSSESARTRYLTFKDICYVSLIGIGLGILLVSGKAFDFVRFLLEMIQNLFSRKW